MFTKNKTNGRQDYPTASVTMIAAGTTVHGDIESESDMRVDGNIIGNVVCKAKIVLGESGIIQGDLHSSHADVFGTINGNVATKELLVLKAKSTINGNLSTGRLQIEPNAIFNGKCTMTSEQPTHISTSAPALQGQEN